MLVQFSQLGIFLTLAFGGFCFGLIAKRFPRKTRLWLNVCGVILTVHALEFSQTVTDGNLTLSYLLEDSICGILVSGLAIGYLIIQEVRCY